MITVVHVITKLELGGAQENTLYTCAHLDRRRFRVGLLFGPGGLLDPDAHAMAATRVEAVPQLMRSLSPLYDPVCVEVLRRRFRELLREHRRLGLPPGAFIVHTHSSKAGILGRLAARAAGVPKVVHGIHGFGFYEGQAPLAHLAFEGAERAMAPLTDAFIGVSRANLAEARARRIILPRHEVRLIRSGMQLEPIRAAAARRGEARAALGIADDDELILSIGNFKPQKDPLTLIEAMATTAALRPRARLLYAGDGELRPAVEARIRTLGLEQRVRLLGWRRDIPELLAAADVVALASLFEGLPRSAVQAVAARRPFVGTRVDGTPEIVRDGRNGYLVEPRQPEALGRALARALLIRPVDPDDEARIEAWDADAMVRAQEELYEALASRP